MILFKGSCHIKLIIDSLSLSILFSLNSNSFPLNSNIPDAQRSKNPFSYTEEDRHKKTYTKYVFDVSGNSPKFAYAYLGRCLQVHLFFTFLFLLLIFVSFAKKVNPWCLQLYPFFCFSWSLFSPPTIIRNPYSSLVRFGAKTTIKLP